MLKMELVSSKPNPAPIVVGIRDLYPGIWECAGHLYLIAPVARIGNKLPKSGLAVFEFTGINCKGPHDQASYVPGSLHVQPFEDFIEYYVSTAGESPWKFTLCPDRQVVFSGHSKKK